MASMVTALITPLMPGAGPPPTSSASRPDFAVDMSIPRSLDLPGGRGGAGGGARATASHPQCSESGASDQRQGGRAGRAEAQGDREGPPWYTAGENSVLIQKP